MTQPPLTPRSVVVTYTSRLWEPVPIRRKLSARGTAMVLRELRKVRCARVLGNKTTVALGVQRRPRHVIAAGDAIRRRAVIAAI